MSNASNLSTLANVLDDGSDGQFLKSTGSGGVAFDTVAAGAVVYATADLLPLSGFAAGDMAYVTATNRFYINNGSGWYSISLVNTNPNITSVQDAGSNTTPFTLATDQTATVITITAADPEDVPLTYGYSVTSGSLNGSTVAQGTGSNSNVFTVTPHASQDATFTLTFTASDGINQATSANVFSLSFITTVADSNHTAMLVQAVGANNGVNSSHPTVLQYLTDSSSSNRSVTVDQGLNVTTGTFSPYRSGGYSVEFVRASSERFELSSLSAIGSGDFSIEFWIYSTSDDWMVLCERSGSSNNGFELYKNGNNQTLRMRIGNTNYDTLSTGTVISKNEWHFVQVVRESNTIKIYIDDNDQSLDPSTSNSTNLSVTSDFLIGGRSSYYVDGYIRDFRISTSARSKAVPSEPLTADSDTLFITCHKPYIIYETPSATGNISVDGSPTLEPFSPYDYEEYDATDNGGSIYFSGSSDYAQASSSNDFLFSDAPATINFWFYPKSNSTDSLIDAYGNGSAYSFHVYLNNGIGLEWRDNSNDYRSMGPYAVGMNQWHYVSIVRDSTTLKFYIGTDLKGTTTIPSNSDFGSNDNLNFGGKTSSWHYNGYMTDIRIVKGTAITPTTVPTAPLTNVTNTKLLLKGTDAAIIDKSGSDNLTLTGNTKCTTTAVVYNSNTINSKSILFDGSGDYIPVITDFFYDKNTSNASTTKFTIETWVYHTARLTSSGYNHIFQTIVGLGNVGLSFGIGPSGNLKFYHASGSTNVVSSTSTISLNTWTHIAVIVDGSQGSNGVTLKINGTTDGTGTWNGISTSQSDQSTPFSSPHFTIGRYPDSFQSHQQFAGYLQDLRISNTARTITSAPSAPLEG